MNVKQVGFDFVIIISTGHAYGQSKLIETATTLHKLQFWTENLPICESGNIANDIQRTMKSRYPSEKIDLLADGVPRRYCEPLSALRKSPH